jgi:hypothetical protein
MTPEAKAKELIDKFLPSMFCYLGSGMLTNTYDDGVAMGNAKECALIAVNEIIDNIVPSNHGTETLKKYWQAVKQSLTNL